MKVINKRNFIRLAKFLSLLLLATGFVVGGHVYITVGELKLRLKEANISLSNAVPQLSIIEKNSKIRKLDLENYILFSKDPLGQKFSDAIEKGLIEQNGNSFLINEDLELPELEQNSCDRVRCIQIRKAFPNIPSQIWKALLGTEDFRFLDHRGVDPIAITRAIVVDIIAMKFIQGGSTLTQQLVKNLFLTNEKKLSRKLKEIIYAIYIENILEKEEILSLYLNEVFWGTFEGVYLKGYHAASLAYFGKEPKQLTEYEATILVSFLKGPNYYRLSRGHTRIKQRADAVFKRLVSLKLFSGGKHKVWSEADWKHFEEQYNERKKRNNFKTYQIVSTNREQGLEPFEKIVFIKAAVEKQAEIANRFKGVDFAIKALVLDMECDNFDCQDGFSHYSKMERDKRKAITEEYHQVGSLLKPIVYDSLVKLGRNYDEIVSTKPITLNLISGKWTPKDYSKAKVSEITLREALQKSKNIPLIRAVNEVGFLEVEKIVENYIPRLKKPLSEYPAQLLGAVELSLDEVVTNYRKFILNKCDEIKAKPELFESSVLKYMSVANETTISKLARYPLKNSLIFGKTGTSNKGLDNWYLAFDGSQMFVIWFGVETNRDEVNLRLSGTTSAFLIFQDFINARGKEISEVICK
jgi:penicillin-binding protein 1B